MGVGRDARGVGRDARKESESILVNAYVCTGYFTIYNNEQY